MRIGIDARLWNETGVGRYIRSIFNYLPEIDSENEYVWFFRKKEFDNIDLPLKHWKKIHTDIRWHTIKEQIVLPGVFEKENLDLLHFPYFSFPILYKGKFVITIHDLIFDHFKSGRSSTLPYPVYILKKLGYHFVLARALEKSTNIITLSEASKHEIIQHYKINPEKISVIYESGSLEIKTTESHNDNINTLRPYIVYVGNAHPHKNVEALIESMKIINKRLPKLKLILIGSDKFFYPKLEKVVQAQNLQKNVRVVGEVANNELYQWYKHAEACVTASYMEGFGIPPLEAMSMGCPTIVSNIPVFHEIYADASEYFDPRDPTSIADKVVEVVKSIQKRKSLQEKGYERAKVFSWIQMVKETVAIYKRCGEKV